MTMAICFLFSGGHIDEEIRPARFANTPVGRQSAGKLYYSIFSRPSSFLYFSFSCIIFPFLFGRTWISRTSKSAIVTEKQYFPARGKFGAKMLCGKFDLSWHSFDSTLLFSIYIKFEFHPSLFILALFKNVLYNKLFVFTK